MFDGSTIGEAARPVCLAQAAQQGTAFLTVPELAELLHVNEKKIYQLAGCGEIPGTKVTGKWIFPRQLIDDWLLENSHGGVMHDRLLIGGSDDELVHQVCNSTAISWQQHALLSYSPSGTRHGLRMLDTGRIDACFINWGASECSARRHLGLLRSYRNHASWVVIRCITRIQGLIADSGVNTSDLAAGVRNRHLRWALRQQDCGSKRFLEDWCAAQDLNLTRLNVTAQSHSELGAAAAVNQGRADICCGTRSTASEFSLNFVPIANVSVDLVMHQKTYFRTLVQDFIKRLQDAEAMRMAQQLGGYTIMPRAELIIVEL